MGFKPTHASILKCFIWWTVESPATQVIEEGDEYVEEEEESDVKGVSISTTRSKHDTASFRMTSREARTISVAQR